MDKPTKSGKWVDYQKLKDQVTIEMVLEHYPQFNLKRTNARNLQGKCELPTHPSDDRKNKNSFGADTIKNVWACQSKRCIEARGGKRGGNVVDLVAVMESSATFHDAALLIASWFPDLVTAEAGEQKIGAAPLRGGEGKQRAVRKERRDQEQGKQVSDNGSEKQGSDEGFNKPLNFTALKNVDPSHNYFTHRGIRAETAAHFGVGFFSGRSKTLDRFPIVFPIHNVKGELVAYAGRKLDGEDGDKYKFPAGFKKSLELFNLHCAIKETDSYDTAMRSRGVVVVEGFFDAMKIFQAGYPCVVALMGCSLSETQEQMLRDYFDIAYLMLDGDAPGVAATGEILAQLSPHMFVRVVEVPLDSQPDKLSSEAIQQLLGSL